MLRGHELPPQKTMVIRAKIQSKGFSKRLHLMEVRGEREGELDSKVAKTGIRVANFFHKMLGKSTEVRIGNKSYHLNTNSLKKYLVRQTDLNKNSCSSKIQNAAVKAFKDSTAPGRGSRLLRHARVHQMKASHYETTVQIPSVTSEQNEDFSTKDAWLKLFISEERAYNEIRHLEQIERTKRRLEATGRGLNVMDRFTSALDGLVSSNRWEHLNFTSEKRSQITEFVEKLSTEKVLELTEQLETSQNALETLSPYIDSLKTQKELRAEKMRLEELLSNFTQIAESSLIEVEKYKTISNIIFKNSDSTNSPEALVEVPVEFIREIEAESRSLSSKMEAYNQAIKNYQRAHADFKEIEEKLESEIKALNKSRVLFIEKEAEWKKLLHGGKDVKITFKGLTPEAIVSQYQEMGVLTLRAHIERLQSSIDQHQSNREYPQSRVKLEEARTSIESIQEKIKILKNPPEKKQLLKILDRIDKSIADLEAEHITLQVENEGAINDPSTEHDLLMIKKRIFRLQEDHKLYRKLIAASFGSSQISKEIKKLQNEIKGLEKEAGHYKSNCKKESQASKRQVEMLNKILKGVRGIHAKKAQSFRKEAQSFFKKHALQVEGDLQLKALKQVQNKAISLNKEMVKLIEKKDRLSQKEISAYSHFKTTSNELVTQISSTTPELLTEEHQLELLNKLEGVETDLKAVDEWVNQFNVDRDIKAFIRDKFGKEIPLSHAYAFCARAQIIHRNFLALGVNGSGREELSAQRTNMNEELTHLNQSLENLGVHTRSNAEFNKKLIFSGARASIARSGNPGAELLKSSFDGFMSIHQSERPDYDTESLASSGSDSAYSSEGSVLEAPYENTPYESLWLETWTPPSAGENKELKFVEALGKFDETYFSHSDEEYRLDSSKGHLPLIGEHSKAFLMLFIGKNKQEGLNFDYDKMAKFIDKSGQSFATLINDSTSEYSQEALSTLLITKILLKGLEERPEEINKLKTIIHSMAGSQRAHLEKFSQDGIFSY